MPPVVLAVISIGSAVIGAVGGAAFLAGLSLSAFVGVTLVAGTAVIAGGAMLATKLMMPEMPGVPDTDKSRQVTSKSTVEPMKIIYGQALVSGPLVYLGVSGTKNQDLHHVIALAGHEVEAITDIYLDDEVIVNPLGNVTSGTFGPVNVDGTNIPQVSISKYLGTADQTADSVLVARFADYTTYNRGQGIAYIHTVFTLLEATASQELWGKYSPNNIRALVKGRKIYDPRLDVAAGNIAGANPTNASYIAYSDNPALCVADYLTNTNFGMGVATSKVDWAGVIIAANACDVVVPVPGGTEKRFTANGVLFGTDPHMTSINKLLSSMNGSLIYSGGEYVISAGIYQAPTHLLTEDDLAGPVTVKTSVERADRFNTVKSIIIDPAQNHKSVETPRVQLTAALNRDNNEELEREIELPFTNTSYMAQRIAHKLIQMSDQQKLLTFPANLSAMAITVGDRVQVTIGELGFAAKVFRCMGWSFTEDGIALTLAEDDSGSYADPDANEYSTISATGVIENGFPGVPDPQGLSAVGGVNSIDLNWRNPSNTAKFASIIVYASQTDQWSAAVEIGRGIITSFKHDASTEADPISSGDQRYYWVRAIGIGSSANAFSDRNPDNDQSNVNATALTNAADSVEWVNVGDGSGLRPSNNATVGAQASIDLLNSTGAVLGDDDVLNSVVFEDITQVQLAGTGDILELVGGAAVDLQQLGDVAKYAYDADQVLNGYINGLNTSFGNLQETLVDITAGVADVYIQTTAPVAGVGGVPDPIVTASRWYDSDDSNKPYYWNGTTWVDLSDPRIASNQADITAVSASLNTTNTTVSGHTTSIGANASAISVLDSTVIALDGTVTTLSGNYDAFVAQYAADDPVGGVAANSSAISAIDTRVTAAEGTTSTSSTSITELASDLTFYTKLEGTDGNVLQLVGGAEIDLQGTSAVGGATSAATNVLDSRITSAEGTITSQASSITALSASITSTNTNVSGNATAISGLTVIVESQGDLITASAADITSLEVSLATESSTRASAVSALDVRVTENEGDITSQASLITGLQSELDLSQLDITANASATSALTTRVTTAEGTITAQGTSITTLTSNLATTNTNVTGNATAISGIDTRVTSAEGTITSQATAITNLTTTVGTNTASISTQATSINGIEANYGVKVDINGRITGFGLNSTVATATPFSEFYVIADRFAVVDPASTASTPIIPFTVAAGLITMGTNVRISGNLVTTGTISADRISIDGVTLDTDGIGNLIVATDGISTAQIATSAVTINELADSIQSSDYVTGVSGWKITKAGASEFSNVVVRGNVDAGSISINGDYLSVVDGALTVISAPGTEVTAAGESTDGGTASATVTRVTGSVTTIQVSFRMFDTAPGAVPSPFPVALTLKRGATTIATFDGIQGEFELGGGAEPSVAFGSFGATFFDSDTGTGSTTYNLTCSTSDFSTSFQIIVKSTRP